MALSCGSPRLAVSQHLALWSPDLPRPGPARAVRAAATRPAHRHVQSRIIGRDGTQPVDRVTHVAGISQPSLIDDHSDALSISALYDRVELAIARALSLIHI